MASAAVSPPRRRGGIRAVAAAGRPARGVGRVVLEEPPQGSARPVEEVVHVVGEDVEAELARERRELCAPLCIQRGARRVAVARHDVQGLRSRRARPERQLERIYVEAARVDGRRANRQPVVSEHLRGQKVRRRLHHDLVARCCQRGRAELKPVRRAVRREEAVTPHPGPVAALEPPLQRVQVARAAARRAVLDREACFGIAGQVRGRGRAGLGQCGVRQLCGGRVAATQVDHASCERCEAAGCCAVHAIVVLQWLCQNQQYALYLLNQTTRRRGASERSVKVEQMTIW